MKRIAVAMALVCAFVLLAAAQVTPGPQGSLPPGTKTTGVTTAFISGLVQ